jgi:hypothetical protein
LILSGRQLRSLIANGKNIVWPSGESPSSWELQIEDAMAEWRSRQQSRRAGVGVFDRLSGRVLFAFGLAMQALESMHLRVVARLARR